MQKWINWSESCLLASLTESKMDYLIRTLPVCITHWVKKDYPIRTLSVFITHWVKSMQVRLFSKAARNYLNQKTTCQFRTVAISSSSSTRCLSSGSKLSKDEWREKIKYFKAHVVLSFSSHALFYILYSFTLMLEGGLPLADRVFYIFSPFSFFFFFPLHPVLCILSVFGSFFTFFFCIDAWCFSIRIILIFYFIWFSCHSPLGSYA